MDTGAEKTVVRHDFVPKEAYTGRYCMLDSWRGSQPSRHRLAQITLEVGSTVVTKEVAVAETLDCPALLGVDLGEEVTIALMQHVISVSARSKLSTVGAAPSLTQSSEPVVSGQSEQVGVEAAPIRGTRAGLVKDLAEIRADEDASAQSECRPIDLLHEMDIPEAYFEDSPEVIPVEELSTLPEVKEVEVPLPRIDGARPDRDKLIAEQQADGTLLNILGLAKKSEKGYGFEQGVLVHCSIDSLGDSCQRVVVPKVRRDNVLELGHSSPVAGHFGCKKTYAKISKHFIWPRVWKDVKAFVKTCAGCQRAARNTNARAPLQPLPCVSEPLEKVAFDLVGP